MTGWVDPSYGFGNPTLGLSSLSERVYRGFKRDEDLVQANNDLREFLKISSTKGKSAKY